MHVKKENLIEDITKIIVIYIYVNFIIDQRLLIYHAANQ